MGHGKDVVFTLVTGWYFESIFTVLVSGFFFVEARPRYVRNAGS